MRGYHNVFLAFLDHQIVNRRRWQVQLQRLPRIAPVERGPNALLSSGVEEVLFVGVFADYPRELIGGNSVGNHLPVFAVIGRFQQIGLEIVQLVARGGQVNRPLVVRRHLHDAHQRKLGQEGGLRRDVLPVLAAVFADVNQAIV